MTKIKEALEQMMKKRIPVQVISAKVTSVNENAATCDCKPSDDGPELFDVRIRSTIDNQAEGIVVVPKIGSDILVGCIQNNVNQSFVLTYSEIDKIVIHCENIQLNGDAHGAVVKIQELVTKINRLEQALVQHQHSYSSPGGPAITTPDPVTTTLVTPNTTINDLANNHVKHG